MRAGGSLWYKGRPESERAVVKRLLLVPVLLCLLPVLLLGWMRLSNPPQPLPEGSDSAARLAPGPHAVASFDERFVDDSRRTPANGDFAGAPQRELEGTVWYPQEPAGPVPLLLFSHGFTSMRGNGRYLAEHLASHGYAVVAVDYPLTSLGAPGGPNERDVVNQPGDLSFLIDTLLAYSDSSGHRLSGRLDAARIGVFGISLGGLTSTLATYHPQWRDPRIAASISIAGPTLFFTERFFAGVQRPFLMLAGEQDALVPYATNAAPIPGKVPGGELLTVHGASHTGFSGGALWFRGLRNPDAIGCFAVERSIEDGSEDSWAGMLGSPAQGIDYDIPNELCRVDPLPEALNVSRQHMITRLVVTAFFDREFAPQPRRRAAAGRFLSTTLPAELAEVSYRGPATGGD